MLNLLSVGAAYGVVVAIFQWGWGSSLVGIDETLPIPAFVPMLMFAIVFGLSMDYEVFLHLPCARGVGQDRRRAPQRRHRHRQHRACDHHRGRDHGRGLQQLRARPDPTVKMLAVGMAAAVLIDASVIRMILVPAVMSLLGRHAWWMPRWLDRITPNLDIEGSGHLARVAQEEQAALAGPAPAP